jgi:RHS repeat-associated protein
MRAMKIGKGGAAVGMAAIVLQTLIVHSVLASGTESGTVYNAGVDLGDPIMANSGQYHFIMPLMNLGGPLPLRFTLRHRTRGPSSSGLPWAGNLQHNLDPKLEWMPHDDTNKPINVLNVYLRNNDVAGFGWNAASNRWDPDPAMPTRYTMHETGASHSNGWYCLSDPLREHVYLFEKNPEMAFDNWAESRLRCKMDRNYNRHTYLYHPDYQGGLVTNVSDGTGRSFEFEHEGGSLTGVVDQAGRRIRFVRERDPADADVFTVVRSVVDAGGGTSTFHYTSVGFVTPIVAMDRPLGNRPYSQTYTQVVLNAETNVRATSQTDAYGNTTVIAYDAGMNRVTETRPDGATAVYEHFDNHAPLRSVQDEAGQSVDLTQTEKTQTASVTDRLGDTTVAGYHPVTGKITSYRDAEGNLYSNRYAAVDQVFTNPATADVFTNRFYNLVRREYPDGTYETYATDGRGNLLSRRGRNGHQWAYTYNARGQVLTVTNPEGGVSTLTYNPDATLASRTDSDTGVTTYAYDAHKRVIGIARPDGTSVGFGYDPSDRLIAYTNANGAVTMYDYDANGNLLSVTDPLAHARSYLYDAMDRVTNVTDSVGPLQSHVFDSVGRLTEVVDAEGVATTVDYDPRGWSTNETRAGRSYSTERDDEGVPVGRTTPLGFGSAYGTDGLGMVTGVVNALNGAYAYERDGMGRVVRSENPLGQVHTCAYDGLGRLASFTAPVVGTTTYVRNGLGQIVALTNFNGETWARGYTGMGRLAAVTNPLGNATAFSYDTMGRLERTDYVDGTHIALTYDDAGRVRTRRDRGGHIHSYGYDQVGRMTSSTNPAGGVVSRTYNPDGTLATGTDTDLGVYSRSYDALRRLTAVTAPGGAVTRYLYDAFNRVTNSIDLRGDVRVYEYDADGRLVRVVGPVASARRYAYDALGRMTNVTDRLGNRYRCEYDAIGRVVRKVDPEGVTVDYAYDAANRRAGTTVGGQTWRYDHDNEGAPVSRTTPLGRTTTYRRDALGSVVEVTDPMGRKTTVVRDELQRMTESVDPLGRTNSYTYEARGMLTGAATATLGATYDYNDLGRLDTLRDPGGHDWTFTYSDMGRPLTRTDPLSRSATNTWDDRGRVGQTGFADSRGVTVGRDSAGNVTNRTYTDGTRIAYEYDPLNRLVRTAGTPEDVSFAYDAESRVIAADSAGTVFGATYDRAGRLKTATYNNGAFAVTYRYNAAGLLTRVEDNLTGTELAFSYDADRRLVGITRPNGVDSLYTWDDAGRIVRIQDGSVLDLRYTLDAAGQVTRALVKAPLTASSLMASGTEDDTFDAAAQTATAGHVFDARGRQTMAPGLGYAWNDASRLVAVDDGIDGLDLSYNGPGRVATRRRGAVITRAYYNYAIGTRPVVAERDDVSGQFLRYYVWTPRGRLLYAIDVGGGNAVLHYHFDRTGSTLALTDAAGGVTDAYVHSPYGRLVGRSGTSAQPYTYNGQFGVWREGTGELYCMPVRYYDAAAGRFLARDPVWPLTTQVKSLNAYQFGLLNPIRYGDPQGASAISFDSLFRRWADGGPAWSRRATLSGSADVTPPPEPIGPWQILGQMGKAFAQYVQRNPDSPLVTGLSREQRFRLLMIQMDIITGELDDGEEPYAWLDEFERQMEDFTSEHRDPFYRELDRSWREILRGAGLPPPGSAEDNDRAGDPLPPLDTYGAGILADLTPSEPMGPWEILGQLGQAFGEYVLHNPDSALAQSFTDERRFQMLMNQMDAITAGLDDDPIPGADPLDPYPWITQFERQMTGSSQWDREMYPDLETAWNNIVQWSETGVPTGPLTPAEQAWLRDNPLPSTGGGADASSGSGDADPLGLHSPIPGADPDDPYPWLTRFERQMTGSSQWDREHNPDLETAWKNIQKWSETGVPLD